MSLRSWRLNRDFKRKESCRSWGRRVVAEGTGRPAWLVGLGGAERRLRLRAGRRQSFQSF